MKVVPKNVLVVDDDEVIQTLLKRRLTSELYKITTVSTAEAALHHLNSDNAYDVVLCDLQLPRMTGLELSAELKRLKNEIPVILMTAFGSMESAIQAVREGV